MIAAIAKIHDDPDYSEPMFHAMLDGLTMPAYSSSR